MAIDKKILCRKWVRSHEEDSGNEMVYRPETYSFPLRRGGRDAMDLKGDTSFIERNTAADDRYSHADGHWEVEGENVLSLKQAGELPKMTLKIVSLTENKLVVKK